jgi:DNA-binding beta-propeller fold protein YncE
MSRILSALAIAALLSSPANAADFNSTKDAGGLKVSLGVHPVTPGAALEEDATVAVTVRIEDGKGKTMPTVTPAAWMSLRGSSDKRPDAERCKEKIATFTAGNVFVRPEVDLNVFHVIALNDDSTVTVVDPHFGFGGSRLLAMVDLRARGEDWAFNTDSSLLFISMPDAGAVAVVDTSTWKIAHEIAVGEKPSRVVLAPDGRHIWVADSKGAVALRPDGSGIAARIATAEPAREIVLTDDGRTAAIAGGKSVTLADTVSLATRGSVALSSPVAGADFSHLSKRFYVGTADGQVSAIDPKKAKIVAHFVGSAGPVQLRFEPDGRLGFLVVPATHEVQIFDAVTNRIIQTADVEPNPDRISFSDHLAYVRSLGSDIVLMIPLDKIGTPGAPVPVVDFPAGQKKFGEGPAPSIADGIVPAPGEPAVLVGHPADREIYYYREGMAAPMGHFSNDGRAPRAVLVLDRSLRRGGNGEFHTMTRLGLPGTYDVAVFVDSPRVITCFSMEVAPNEVLAAKRRRPSVVQYAEQNLEAKAGQPMRIAFRIIDPATKALKTGLQDVTALLFAPGVANSRQTAVAQSDGTYVVDVVPPAEGVYYFSIDCPSARLLPNNPDRLILRARG